MEKPLIGIHKTPGSSSSGKKGLGKSDLCNGMDGLQMHFGALKKPDSKDNLIPRTGHSCRKGQTVETGDKLQAIRC